MIKIIFDATCITRFFTKNSSRSGVYFTARNVLDELLKKDDVQLYLYFSPEAELASNYLRMKKELYPKLNYVQNIPDNSFLIKLNQKLWNIHTKIYSHNIIRKFFALGILITQHYIRRLFEKACDKNILKTANVYLSPIYKTTKFIRQNKNLTIYTIIYDIIPILFLEYNVQSWSSFIKKICDCCTPEDYFFSISKQTKKDFQKITPLVTESNTFITPLAAHPNFRQIQDENKKNAVKQKYAIPSDKKYVFSLCTLEPRKNLIRAVKTFIDFVNKNKIDDFCFVLGGSHWESFIDEIKKTISEFDDNAKYIIHAGYIDDEDLPVLYSNAEWFVYTSQYEGFGLPPLEAMQCGCPVITSNNSSLPEVVGDAGIMIDWDNDDQHITAYEKYYFNQSLREENSRKGLERAKLFSWKKTADLMVETMKANLSRGGKLLKNDKDKSHLFQ